jgi:hypothetical protein
MYGDQASDEPIYRCGDSEDGGDEGSSDNTGNEGGNDDVESDSYDKDSDADSGSSWW